MTSSSPFSDEWRVYTMSFVATIICEVAILELRLILAIWVLTIGMTLTLIPTLIFYRRWDGSPGALAILVLLMWVGAPWLFLEFEREAKLKIIAKVMNS